MDLPTGFSFPRYWSLIKTKISYFCFVELCNLQTHKHLPNMLIPKKKLKH
jgi:hypothetical protein